MGDLVLIWRLGLALVFGVAAVARLADLDRTGRSVARFGVADRVLWPASAALSPWELAVAVLFVVGYSEGCRGRRDGGAACFAAAVGQSLTGGLLADKLAAVSGLSAQPGQLVRRAARVPLAILDVRVIVSPRQQWVAGPCRVG